MQVTQQHRSTFFEQEQHPQSTFQWQVPSISRQGHQNQMATRVHQPLIFSIDDRLADQHLTRLDLSAKNLRRIEPISNEIQFNILIFDHNEINKLEHLDALPYLIQLSVADNRLVDIRLLSRLRSLQKLNLSHNQIDSIDSLRTLENLVMLNISHNHIHTLAPISACRALQSLDASCNAIQQIDDLSQLTSLKYLNLHKNFINTLLSASRYWPKSLHTLVISDNEIHDLTEIACLSSLIDLNTLYLVDNPCLSVVDERRGCHQPFDYRPYVLNWCVSIHNLDGIFTTRKEGLKAEWLLSQGKGRSFRTGEHAELVQYLIKVCGTDANERDDLHLSRVMLHQDVYHQQRQSTPDDIQSYELTISTSEAATSNYENLSTYPEEKSRGQSRRTPSPVYGRMTSALHADLDDQPTEISSSRQYHEYDNRPIKPLDQQLLQSKLSEYPVKPASPNRFSPLRASKSSNSQSVKRTSTPLAYNANRYSPKTTTRGPTASSALHVRSMKTLSRHSNHRLKRPIKASTSSINESQLSTSKVKVTARGQQAAISISNDNKNQSDDDVDEEEDDPFTAVPLDRAFLTPTTTMNNSIDIQKLTGSVETMRASVLNAYFDLHERFTKTTELQTSALTALWKKFEDQSLNHRRETEEILRENRLLHQRMHELERRLEANESKSVHLSSDSTSGPAKNPSTLYPPLRAHISKRDTRSFFLHWIPNPLNEHRKILGYRIYIDDRLKGAIGPGQFEAIIDSIRDEGEYRIKIRTYDEHSESPDSNIVVARFRRQHAMTPRVESYATTDPPPTDFIIHDNDSIQSQNNLINLTREETRTPMILDKQQRTERERALSGEQQNEVARISHDHATPEKIARTTNDQLSPYSTHPLMTQEVIISLKPPKSPTSSPNRTDRTSPHHGSCMKVLFTNNSHQNDGSTVRTTKRSPTRTGGIMSRLSKSPYRIKRNNNVLLNALPQESNTNATEKNQTHEEEQDLLFHADPINHDRGHLLVQEVAISNVDIFDSMIFEPSTSPPPPLPPRIARS